MGSGWNDGSKDAPHALILANRTFRSRRVIDPQTVTSFPATQPRRQPPAPFNGMNWAIDTQNP
ncbi:MAG: hypothetical protein EAZ61_02460 [Oscillatoriales cyanobacterium]|nr:MAG: hypothetical protein EAZ61_02460 [Oscillatoriales cyanobacterium]